MGTGASAEMGCGATDAKPGAGVTPAGPRVKDLIKARCLKVATRRRKA